MIQVYSTNIAVDEDSFIPLQNVKTQKGCSASMSGVSTINLNKCGVYKITVDGSATPTTAGLMSIDLYKNGVALPEAQSSVTGTADAVSTMGFTTYVQVSSSNSCKCFDSPVSIQIFNSGVDATFLNVNVTVDKVC